MSDTVPQASDPVREASQAPAAIAEPVAWVSSNALALLSSGPLVPVDAYLSPKKTGSFNRPLYAAPIAQQASPAVSGAESATITGVDRAALPGLMYAPLLPRFLRGVADGLREGIGDARDAPGIEQAADALAERQSGTEPIAQQASSVAGLTDKDIEAIYKREMGRELRVQYRREVLRIARAVIAAAEPQATTWAPPNVQWNDHGPSED